MAATFSFFPTLDHHHHLTPHTHFTPTPTLRLKLQSFSSHPHKLTPPNFITHCQPPSLSSPQTHQNPLKFERFLTNEELRMAETLQNFTYSCKIPSGCLTVKVMQDSELDLIVELLAESFAESMFIKDMQDMYLKLLGYLIKQYLVERRGLLPHAVTLIGYYVKDRDGNGDENGGVEEGEGGELAGTVEVSFDKRGANASPPTPTPPKNCPYICNMTVKKHLRRKGIGWHLLKASEELISKMTSSNNVYLHCRMVDSAPFSMYQKAGYDVVKTDSLLILLTLQRRKHLMRKALPTLSKSLEIVIPDDDKEAASSMNGSELEPLFDEVVQSSLNMDN